MSKNLLFFPFFLIISFNVYSQDVKVVLTGNTTDLKQPEQLFQMIDQYCQQNRQPVLWVINGDLFHKKLEEKDIVNWIAEAEKVLDQHQNLQLLITQGDRDWNNSGKNGWDQVKELEKNLKKKKHSRVHLYLEEGCPGPWVFNFSPMLEVVIINSQWWNHPFEKPLPSMDICDHADEDIFLEEFKDILDESGNKNQLLISHFPLESMGKYGGKFPVSAYLFPPLVGNAVVAYHQNIGKSTDIVNEEFDAFRHKLNDILLEYNSLIFASGHERNHSIIKVNQNFYVNSGGIGKSHFVSHLGKPAFVSKRQGFIELNYQENGEISYQFYQWKEEYLQTANSGVILKSPCKNPEDTQRNQAYQPCMSPPPNPENDTIDYSKQVHVMAGPQYQMSNFGKFWLGEHYRKSWTTPVKVPYLNLDTTFNGLTVKEKGGGRQTTSLKMKAGNGKEYVFRSVDKDPSKAISYDLRGTIVSKVVKDQTTTQQPYGAMAVDPLLNKIGILHAHPKLYLLPDAHKLGTFRTQYKNLLGMLEDRPTDNVDDEQIFGDADDIVKSYKLFEELYEDHDSYIEKGEFCKARVFDILVGDWGKHEDNWKWAEYDFDGGKRYRPIPRDRDHVFSSWDGVFPYLADREWAKPSGENFDYELKGLRSLMWQARHLDRFLGNELTKEDWIAAAGEIQSIISAKDLEAAVKNMPLEIYETDGKIIENKLKARIKDLPKYAEEYYKLLAKEVDVVGSNKSEYFYVKRNPDGSVLVKVTDLDKKTQQPIENRKYYQRIFYPEETQEIRLFGLMNDDVFLLEGEAETSILVRIISGFGEDKITDQSIVGKGGKHTLVYDKDEAGSYQLGNEGKSVRPKEDDLYYYNRTAFKYNTYFPQISLTYNPFIGLALNSGITFTRQNFSKPDFSAKHHIKGSVTTQGNFELSYSNQIRYLIGKWDGISEFQISQPLNYNYFFGIGNDTENDQNKDKDFYRAQYNSIKVSLGLSRKFWKQSLIELTGKYEKNRGLVRAGSFLAENPDIFGTSALDLIYFKGLLELDFRDRVALPERGFRLKLTQFTGNITQSEDKLVNISALEMEQYLSTYAKNPLTFGLRVGGGITSGQLPYYKLFSLGQLNDLRGYRRNRFTGESKAFLNSLLRWQFVETKNTFIPFKIGMSVFYDIGRVWAETDPESADYWHRGYGAGFYFVPFKEQFALQLSAGRSREEPFLLMFGIGSIFK
ncbi:BamA/TamA family outer membrane protein [Flexithrix dorotheae]|uniref:BamA/TamA family outer membrane protein n=1 Tax=Flexithrix dorotheae TaxID=70993 RepID=UPI0003784210|nr:BamA/TamA family outer membrane protein [Flexithrix dorotheae]